jgi:type VII secretion protein EccB
MPSTPTTKSQVQAYRFVLRRMQSALVRKDAVMLHDPMRSHTRATVVGVCIAAVGVVGFLIWGLLSPKPKPPDQDSIIISKQSGQVYVLISNPRQLIPTFNLASARLLLVARQQQAQQAQGGGQPVTPIGLSSGQAPASATTVDEKDLKDIPRGRLTGLQNGPDLLPGGDQRIEPYWAVCDAYLINPTLPRPASENRVETTVLAGVRDLGPELPETQSLLVQADDNIVYLMYRTPTSANIKTANAVRAKVDMNNPAVRAALKLDASDVRRITSGLLNAIRPAAELKPPPIVGRGEEPNGFRVENLRVGAVFQVQRAGQENQGYYVVQRDGIEPITQTTADLIRFDESLNDTVIDRVAPDAITNVPNQNVDLIDDTESPAVQPEVLNPVANPVACLGWQVTGEGNSADHRTAVYIGDRVPLPRKADGTLYESVRIGTPAADGQRIDRFFMPPGRAAVVRGSNSREDFGIGPIYLISDRGVKYGVPDSGTADVLGLSGQVPAYLPITSLLPDGASLNTRDVLQTYDSVPVAPGVFETTPQQGGNGGG